MKKTFDEMSYMTVRPLLRRVVTPLQDFLLVSRILQWASSKNPFYKTNIELSEETGLTKNEISYVKKRLKKYTFIKVTVRGMPRRTYYEVDWNDLLKKIDEAPPLKYTAYRDDENNLCWAAGSSTEKHKAKFSKESTEDSKKLDYSDSTPVAKDSCQLELNDSTPVAKDSCQLELNDSTPVAKDFWQTVARDSSLLRYSPNIPVARNSWQLRYNRFFPVARDSWPSVARDSWPSVARDSWPSVARDSWRLNNIETTKRLQRDIQYGENKACSFNAVKNKASHIEDKPQSEEASYRRPKKKYSAHFELLWSRYRTRFPKQKGSKSKAFDAYKNTIQLFSEEEIDSIVDKYMQSDLFELSPAHLSTFLNGICKDSKYRDQFVENGFEKRLNKLKEKKSSQKSSTAQDAYKKDISKQGELNANDLIDRTAYISVMLNTKYGLKMLSIERGDRSEWLPYLGPDYVAVPIKHPMSKDEKIKVLFHIDELRSNAYTHLHGHEWNDDLENRYQESNKGIEWIDTLQLPNKEEYRR